jgi:hypothetical protein
MNSTVLIILKETGWISFEFMSVNKEFNSIIPKKFYLNKVSYIHTCKKGVLNIKNVKNIIMSNNFNQKLILYEGIEIINFGEKFNQKIDLPSSLKYIGFYLDNDYVTTEEDHLKRPRALYILFEYKKKKYNITRWFK